MYEMGTIFQVQFCIHFLLVVLSELNNPSQRFQEEHFDITSIGIQLDVLIELLRRILLRDMFEAGSQHRFSTCFMFFEEIITWKIGIY
jgi:hypothetical protein